MGIQRRKFRRRGVAVAGTVAVLAAAGTASAFQALPPGAQVNDDIAAGINPALNVSGEDPTNADVVGGALVAGKVAVPWAIFRQQETGAHDQVFSRSFAAGAWTTRGAGTVGGRSSGAPTPFPGSLNFDQGQDGEAPAIDFAGAGRTVPWATWYEQTTGTGFDHNNIFASRFDNTPGDVNQGKWIFAGQGRGNGGSGPDVPSLNIHTNQDAENPSVAGGSAADATKPGPWVTWQETTTLPVNGADQIFVSRSLPGMTNCDGVTPLGVPDGGHIPAVGGFCWQQTGIGRVGPSSADPSLNVDPTRNGIEPDIAFTGKNPAGVQDGVPWVVWYETGNTNNGISSLTHNNEMVFAAKGLADATPGRGGFSWTAVGNNGSALLDASGTNHFGGCAANDTAEENCSLNANPAADAEDPRVAAGTMNPANATVPWVVWDEGPTNGVKQVFVSRLVGGTQFQLANDGAPISTGAGSSTRPDITFSGNTPYVTWREDTGAGGEKAFVGHFVNAADPKFVLDESDVPLAATAQADVREPISSGCTANPFNQDGAACQGSAVGTPFFLFTKPGSSALSLFSDAYQSSTPITGGPSGVTTSAATVAGSVNPNGAAVRVSFQFGTTTAYGQSTAVQTLGPDDAADPFSAVLAGLPAGTTIHYRAIATGDFGTIAGADLTLTTGSPPPTPGKAKGGKPHVSGTSVTELITCAGQTSCKVTMKLTVKVTIKHHKIVAVSASHKPKVTHKVVVLGTASATIPAGKSKTLRISLNRKGRALLKARHHLSATLTVAQITTGKSRKIATAKVGFKPPKHHGKK